MPIPPPNPPRPGRPPMEAHRRRLRMCVSLHPAQVRFLREYSKKKSIAVSRLLQQIVYDHMARTMRERREEARRSWTPTPSDAPSEEA